VTNRIFFRLLVAFVLVIGIATLAMDFGIRKGWEESLHFQVRSALEQNAVLFTHMVQQAGDHRSLQAIAEDVARTTAVRATIIGSDGKVLADTGADPAKMENHATRPEFIAALQGQIGSATRASHTVGIPFLYVAAPMRGGAVRLAYPLSSVQEFDRHARAHVLQASLVAVFLATIISAFAARFIVTPIAELAATMEQVGLSRDYSVRAEPRGADEVRKLASGFNNMLAEIQASHTRLKQQALHDELTGLPNRRLLADRLSHALAAAKRQQNTVAVIYMDLDGFKLVNDTLGHSVGDLLLRQVAERLRRRVRSSDTIARIGGDEFTIIAAQIRNAKEAALIANYLLAEFATPFVIQEHELMLTASIGISLYPQDGLEAEQIIKQADTAMYVAKSTGKNKATFFTPAFGDAVRERLELENQLRGALERGELAVHYQPEFEITSNRLVRFEALVRWENPTLGMIPPTKFIPIAEESGLIIPIGGWVMEQACAAAARWQTLSHDPVRVAVNVSTIQFLQNNFVEMVDRMLKSTALDPRLLQLELTESVLMPGHGDAMAKLSELRSLGVSLAVDDFGTGYSSLSYLPRLPFDYLKIDRSFLEQIMESKDPRAMMASVINLAHNLQITVIIEGVETPEQLALVRGIGCDEVQGYLFGRPTADPDQYLSKYPGLLREPLAQQV
jgi:diguanylate cyclase (GGDEF)-like protein